MSGFELSLLIGLIIALAVSYGDQRAGTWLGAVAADYIITSAYFYAGLPVHPAFTFLVDGLVSVALIYFWRERWEAILAWIMAISAAVDMFSYFALIDGYAYATALEVANWMALATIGGPHIVELVGRLLVAWGVPSRSISRAHLVFTAARKGTERA